MNSNVNYKKVYALKSERERKIKSICPEMPYSSGIYAFYRDDDSGLRMAYIGQAVNLCERCASHLAEYDHIGLSLKKRGFYSIENPYGWRIAFKTCRKDELDEQEKEAIKKWGVAGFQLYNKTSGSQGSGKTQIAEYKPPKTYRQGIAQGKKSLARELAGIINKHLVVSLKPEKLNNKVSIKQFEKFNELINEENYKE